MSIDFRNKTADLQVTVRHLSRPHHLDADLFSLTSYGPLTSDGNCAFTDCSAECLQRGAQITARALIIGFLRFPYDGRRTSPSSFGSPAAYRDGTGANPKGTGDPEDRPHLPPACGVPSRVHPFEALTAGSRSRNTAHQPHNVTLADRFRQATTKSVIHNVVPHKAHLSRFDPPKGPLRQQSQTACKPGSVPHPGAMPGAVMAIPLGRSSPSASCDRPERRREGSPGIFGSLRDACRSYLVLLPVGFSLPPPLPAARCALTAPFHPCLPPGVPRRAGGVLSVALSLGSPPPGVTRHRASVEPGLSSPRVTAESGHPAVWHRKIWVVVAPLSKAPRLSRSWAGQPRDDQRGFRPDWSPCPSPRPSPRKRGEGASGSSPRPT